MTVNTRIVKLFLRRQDMAFVPLDNGLRLQVLPDITYLPQCQKHHFAAFIQDSSILIVWDDDPNHILARAQGIEDQLMSMIWKEEEDDDDKAPVTPGVKMGSRAASVYVREITDGDGMDEKLIEAPRKTVLIQPILCAITLVLIIAAIGSGWREIAVELKVDKGWYRLGFCLVVPLQVWLALVSSRSALVSSRPR